MTMATSCEALSLSTINPTYTFEEIVGWQFTHGEEPIGSIDRRHGLLQVLLRPGLEASRQGGLRHAGR